MPYTHARTQTDRQSDIYTYPATGARSMGRGGAAGAAATVLGKSDLAGVSGGSGGAKLRSSSSSMGSGQGRGPQRVWGCQREMRGQGVVARLATMPGLADDVGVRQSRHYAH